MWADVIFAFSLWALVLAVVVGILYLMEHFK